MLLINVCDSYNQVSRLNVSLSSRCKMMSLERKCSDGVEQMMDVLGQRMHNGVSPTDLWGKTLSFFTPKKTLLFHNGYSNYSRETLRLFPDSAEDVAPLCIQWQEPHDGSAFAKSWSARSVELNSPCLLEMEALFSYLILFFPSIIMQKSLL